jgi:hypothetical protein
MLSIPHAGVAWRELCCETADERWSFQLDVSSKESRVFRKISVDLRSISNTKAEEGGKNEMF